MAFWALILAMAGVGVYLLSGVVSLKAALLVTSDPEGQTVYLDNQELGTTPLSVQDLSEGEFTLTFGDFSEKIYLTGGAMTVVNWEFGPSTAFSGGERVWFSDSSSKTELLVIVQPVAEVFLNGQSLGNSPLSKSIQAGEYTLEIKKDGYSPRTLTIAVKEGYRLNVSANLSVNPLPEEVSELSVGGDNIKVMDLSTSATSLLADFAAWVEGVAFYAAADEANDYSYFLTAEGKLYDPDGSEIALTSITQQEGSITIGYLGESGKEITAAASTTLDQLQTALFPPPPQVKILETGVGFLRVRSGPGTNHSEIGKATPGEQFDYLGEEGSWIKIDFRGTEGWVSGQYAQKL